MVIFDGQAWADFFAALPWVWPLFAGIVGAMGASFAGVVAYRMPHSSGWLGDEAKPGVSMWSLSRCDSCGRLLTPLETLPVIGWLVHRGRCKTCGAKVPFIYPLMEFLSGLTCAWLAWRFGPTFAGLCAIAMFWCLMTLSWVDALVFWLPDRITLPLLLVGLCFSPFTPEPLDRIYGLALCAVTYWAVALVIGRMKDLDAMSGGDFVLLAAAGAWFGLQAAPAILLLFGFYFLLYMIPLKLIKGAEGGPMGPAIAAAMFTCLLLGDLAHVMPT